MARYLVLRLARRAHSLPVLDLCLLAGVLVEPRDLLVQRQRAFAGSFVVGGGRPLRHRKIAGLISTIICDRNILTLLKLDHLRRAFTLATAFMHTNILIRLVASAAALLVDRRIDRLCLRRNC